MIDATQRRAADAWFLDHGLPAVLRPGALVRRLWPRSLGFMGVTQLLGTHSTAVFTATLISMMSIAVGVQTGLLLWRAAIQLTSSPNRRALHD